MPGCHNDFVTGDDWDLIEWRRHSYDDTHIHSEIAAIFPIGVFEFAIHSFKAKDFHSKWSLKLEIEVMVKFLKPNGWLVVVINLKQACGIVEKRNFFNELTFIIQVLLF